MAAAPTAGGAAVFAGVLPTGGDSARDPRLDRRVRRGPVHPADRTPGGPVQQQLGRVSARTAGNLGVHQPHWITLALLPPRPLNSTVHIMVPGRRTSAYTRALTPGTPGSLRTGAMPEVAHHCWRSSITARAVASSAAVMSRTTRPGSLMCCASIASMPVATSGWPGGFRWCGGFRPYGRRKRPVCMGPAFAKRAGHFLVGGSAWCYRRARAIVMKKVTMVRNRPMTAPAAAMDVARVGCCQVR